ncbi:MAG: tRNA (guanine-N(7)-)-methyltransferase [Parcubacteria group bacterium Gr01-1014_18]|nr:MAG: tRNA (guanine-N(7)-)-methyltransferase [Parcubacteria group bacterium Greene0416_36]TSC81549.1 MAG: tRNA (guanine-N(7)-)-methyltransferase [Parcubacteria group bacterium Gr01-1014_18]TSC99640.1 MAG: tRNA (guanine-N(7)-)-methyltransferase [Parcubacteria group bacterium Greene1014_20]TSD07091.1 MAG: tRNA (guanine-N(7)-)-methyltransferase [Parcubacteria group bacterium Greene0714_2]
MPRIKKKLIETLKEWPGVIEKPDPDFRSKLGLFLSRKGALVMELGCGRGDFTIEMAKKFPHTNFIALDRQGERLWYGAKMRSEFTLENVLFIRMDVVFLREFLKEGSVSEIWLTFPDPFPKKGQAARRLTSHIFLDLYRYLLGQAGTVNLKTDDPNLFLYSKEIAAELGWKIGESTEDIHAQINLDPILQIQTHFEKKHLKAGKKINYLRISK